MAVAKNDLIGTNREVMKNKTTTIFDMIEKGRKQFEAALPKHMNTDRFIRVAITTIRQNTELAKCSVESLLGSLMTIAQLGLEPGVLGQCYLIPFNNKKLGTVECQLQIGYKGMIELLRRTKQLKDIYAYTVYTNDYFSIEYGLERTLKHSPAFDNEEGRGDIKGFYAVAILEDGTRAFEYMTKKEILSHEEKYRKGSYKNSIWDKNFEEMATKTVVKKLLKWLPISVEIVESIRKDEQIHNMNTVTNEVSSNHIEDEPFLNLPDVEIVDDLATDEERVALLKNAEILKIDLPKVVRKELKIDFETMKKSDVSKVQELIDKLIEEKDVEKK